MNEIVQKIEKAAHIVLISHINPDADSLGSASAMYSFLLQKHKKVSWFCKTQNINQKFSCLPWFENIKASFPLSADLAISLDCAHKSRLGAEVSCELINIDHHTTNDYFGDINLVDKDAISTTKILYDFFTCNGLKINKKTATALYAGILDDSNSFTSQNVDGTTFAIVKELIDVGADFKSCNKSILQTLSLAALRLRATMFKNLSLECDGRVAFFCVSYEDMLSSGARPHDCEAPLEESLHLATVEVAVLLRENRDLCIKASLRSKNDFKVDSIAALFGGGGHQNRAGFDLDNTLSQEEVKMKLLHYIKEGLVV